MCDLRTSWIAESAAALLDEERPGWADEIDLGRFDLGSDDNCILGQIYGSYASKRAANIRRAAPFASFIPVEGMQAEWVRLIEARRLAENA